MVISVHTVCSCTRRIFTQSVGEWMARPATQSNSQESSSGKKSHPKDNLKTVVKWIQAINNGISQSLAKFYSIPSPSLLYFPSSKVQVNSGIVTESCVMERWVQDNEINAYRKATFRPNRVQVTCLVITCTDVKHTLLELICMF